MNSLSALLVCIFVGCALAVIDITTPITHFAILEGEQQETPNVGLVSSGIAIFSYSNATGTPTLQWRVVHTVTDPQGAHIHTGLPGSSGAVIVALVAGVGASPIIGSFTMTNTEVSELNAGQYYCNIHSTAFPNGEIRGQILTGGGAISSLLGANEIPTPVTTSAAGQAFFTVSESTGAFTWRVVHTVSGATASHLHGPADTTQTNGVLQDFGGSVSPIVGTATLSSSTLASYTSGRTYGNVHSTNNPTGELRGQVAFPNVRFAAGLDSSQASTASTNTGATLLSVSTDNSTLNIIVFSTIGAVTGLHLHGPGAVGVDAGVLVLLTAAQDSYNYYAAIDSTIAGYIQQGLTYVNLHTTAFPAGEIRGQVVRLGTVATVPSSTTQAAGTTQAGSTAVSTSTGSTDSDSSFAPKVACSFFLAFALALVFM